MTPSIDRLPDELLIRIFVLLSPPALTKVQRVCKRWHRIASNDQHWRSALLVAFGRVPFRRLRAASWREEYIERYRMIQRWGSHWVVSIELRPRIDVITHTFIDLDACYMLVGNLRHGIAIQCNPFTGKINKRGIKGCPEDDPTMARSMLIERGRILWGYRTGFVALTQLDRGTAVRHHWVFQESHEGAVTVLVWSANMPARAASGSTDGTVRIWDTSARTCLGILRGATGAVHLLAYDTRSYVVACTEEKHLIAWACQQPYDAPPCLCLPLDAKPTELILQDKHCVVAVEDRVLLVSLAAGKVVKTLTVAGRGAVTCVKWSKATGVLCCGFAAGTIALWDTATILETSSPSSSMPEPLWLIEAHDGPITALAVDTYKVVSGSVDGAIRVWNVLDATPLREFSLGRDEEASWPVSTFSMTDTALMVVSGGRAICLRLNHSTHSTKKTSKSKKVRTPRRSAYELEQEQLERESPRGRIQYEIQSEMRETAYLRAEERAYREQERALIDMYGTLGDMTEEELLQYTMMLSLEETSNATMSHASTSQQPTEQDLLDQEERDLIQAVILSTLPDDEANI